MPRASRTTEKKADAGRGIDKGFSEPLFQTIFETTGTATVIIEEDTTISRMNRGFELLTGYSKGEVEGKRNWKEFVEESYRAKMTEYHVARRTEPGSVPARYGFLIIRKDHNRRYVYVAVAMIPGTKRSVASLLDITGHVETEEALRKWEQRYRGLFETLPDGFVSIDLNRRIVDSNPAFQAMVGYTREELSGFPYHRLTPEKWHTLVDKVIREEILRAGYSAVYVKEYLKKDGAVFPVEVRAHLLKDRHGNPLEIWGFVRDVSKRRKMEKHLWESEEKFRLLFEKSADAALLLDGDVFVDCNEAALSLMRCQEQERLIGLRPADISPERQPDGLLSREKVEKLTGIARREGAHRFEWVHRDFSGREVWVDVSLTAIPIYGRPMIFTMWRDITKRKEAEAQLRESEERCRVAIEHSNDGVTIVSGRESVYVNQRLLRIFGYERPEEITEGPRLSFVHPDDRGIIEQRIRRRQLGEAVPQQYEFRGLRKDGTELNIEASVARITYRGKPASLAYLRDVTETKLAEAELRRSEEKFRRIFENAMEGIFQTSPEGKFLNANPAFARIFGYESPEELMDRVTDVGRQLYVEPEDRARTLALLDRHNSLRDVETEFLHRKGFRIWVSINYNTIRDENGETLCYEGTCIDVTQRRLTEEALRKREKELETESVNLEEANTALKVLLKHREDDKAALENTILANMKEMVLPYVERMKGSHLDEHQLTYLSILESSLKEIVSPILQKMSAGYARFTRMEIQVATLTRAGKTSKEIALVLGLSKRTIDTHKNNIRKKLGLINKKANLHAYLRTM
jgi:PAS domain S-box-containing protein